MTGKDMAKPIFDNKWRWAVTSDASVRAIEFQAGIALSLIMMFFGREK